MSNDLIVMDNSIVTSAYNLTLNEQRLIYCALKQMPKGEPVPPDTPFFIGRDDFIEMGVDPNNVARDIRQATRDLMKKSLKVLHPLGEREIPWLYEVLRYDKAAEEKLKERYPNPEDYSRYINALRFYNLLDALPTHKADDNIVARIVFHDKIMPLLSDLRANFTQFLAQDVAQFRSIYSFRVYQVMMQYQSTGYVRIGLDDLRYMLMLGNKYTLVADLKKRVIDVAVKEINEKSPYNLQCKMIKKGRKFVALELFFERKDKQKTAPNKGDDPFVNFKMTKKQMAVFASKIKQATNQDVDEIIAELSNVHLQGKHVGFLKILDFVPSEWYSENEIKSHPTPEQLLFAKKAQEAERIAAENAKKQAKEQHKEQQKIQFEQDAQKLMRYAEEFALANKKHVRKIGVEQYYFDNGEYENLVSFWKRTLEQSEIYSWSAFNKADEILARD